MSAPWQHGDPRAVMHAVLSQDRYRDALRPPPAPGWWDRFAAWLHDLWHRLLAPLGQVHGGQHVADAIGIALLAIVACALAALAVRYAGRPGALRRSSDAWETGALAGAVNAAALHARALDAAAAGRNREAAALLWISALHALDESGRVRYDPTRTPGEWRRAVGDPAFDALARDAVGALFAGRADAALVARMRDAYLRVVPA